MIVDIHTHLWPPQKTPDKQKSYFESRGLKIEKIMSADGLIANMEGYADVSVIATLSMAPASNSDLESYHKYVTDCIKKYPGKFYAFCCVDPLGGSESVGYLKKYLDSGDFIGLKLHPNVQSFYPNDERVFPVYECLEKYGLPVLFHSGGIGVNPFFDAYASIDAIEEVACRFPGMPIVLGHAGRGKHFDTASVLRKHPNVYADVSANFARLKGYEHTSLLELIKTVKIWTGTTEKLLFGSDYPFYTDRNTTDALDMIVRSDAGPVTAEDIDNIKYNNAYAFLKKYVFDNKK